LKKHYQTIVFLAALLPLFFSSNLYAQPANCTYGPELRFIDVQLESGTDKQVGATYRYSNVVSGVDALVTISAASNASLVQLDMTSTGKDSAFQPQVKILNQPSQGGVAYMDFQINFVAAGTNDPTAITAWKATAVDVDGDSYRLRESVAFYSMDAYTLENNSNLNSSAPEAGMKQFEAQNVNNQPGITTGATEHMITAEYFNRTSFLYRARIVADAATKGPSGADERMFSLNFNPCLINSYTDPNSFPVEWLGFDGRVIGEEVVLDWATASELNNNYFEVERAIDGENFERIGVLAGNGTTQEIQHYQFIDMNPKNGSNYYRLKQVDLDGQFAFSEIVNLNVAPSGFRYAVFPNPTSDFLNVSTTDNKIVNIELLNLNGQVVNVSSRQMDAFQWELTVDHVQPGTYFIRVETEDSHNAPQKVVIR
jgi:hypothetical protein